MLNCVYKIAVKTIVGVCSSNSLATRRGTRNLIYILLLFFLIFLQLLLTQPLSRFYQLLYFFSTSASTIVAVLIPKAGHVWVSWPEEFLLYALSLTLQQVCYCPTCEKTRFKDNFFLRRVLCSNLKRKCRLSFFFRKKHQPCNTNMQWRIIIYRFSQG